jgi:dipeptidyl aminopeptidase/acylaminoacyl peptidase
MSTAGVAMSRTRARRGSRRYFANLLGFAAVASVIVYFVVTAALVYRTASNYTQPPRSAPAVTPEAYGQTYRDVRLETEDGVRLAAWHLPGTGDASLIMVHGLGGNRGDVLPLARAFARRGYGLLLLDLRAHGASGGHTSTLGLHEVRDVNAAVLYLQAQPGLDPNRIGIYGHSLGAATAIMAGAELASLKAIVADSAFASVEWLAHHQFNALSRLPAPLAPLVVRIGSWQTGVDPVQIAPVRQIGRISPRPVMIIHSELDGVLLADNGRQLAEAAREPKEVWIVPGVRHAGAYGADPERYVERVASFFGHALR